MLLPAQSSCQKPQFSQRKSEIGWKLDPLGHFFNRFFALTCMSAVLGELRQEDSAAKSDVTLWFFECGFPFFQGKHVDMHLWCGFNQNADIFMDAHGAWWQTVYRSNSKNCDFRPFFAEKKKKAPSSCKRFHNAFHMHARWFHHVGHHIPKKKKIAHDTRFDWLWWRLRRTMMIARC